MLNLNTKVSLTEYKSSSLLQPNIYCINDSGGGGPVICGLTHLPGDSHAWPSLRPTDRHNTYIMVHLYICSSMYSMINFLEQERIGFALTLAHRLGVRHSLCFPGDYNQVRNIKLATLNV